MEGQSVATAFAVVVVAVLILAIVGFIWHQKKNQEQGQAFGPARGRQRPAVPVPTFSAGNEGSSHGLVAAAMGFARPDIGDRGFDDTFKIKSDDQLVWPPGVAPGGPRAARHTGPWNWRLSGQNVISYDDGALEPEYALPQLNLMCDLLDRIPADAWTGH